MRPEKIDYKSMLIKDIKTSIDALDKQIEEASKLLKLAKKQKTNFINEYWPVICHAGLANIYDPPKVKNVNYVYIMHDLKTGFYKIGRSINPKVRERTLQSEKPEIELIFCRALEKRHEIILHNEYADFRVRGEWFDITNRQLMQIKLYLQREFKSKLQE